MSGYFRFLIPIFRNFKPSSSPESRNIRVWISEFHLKLILDWAGFNRIDPVWAHTDQIKKSANFPDFTAKTSFLNDSRNQIPTRCRPKSQNTHFVESKNFAFDSEKDSKKSETRGMDVGTHCYYREFTAKYSTPYSILTVNIKLNTKVILYSNKLYAYMYPIFPILYFILPSICCPSSPAALLRTSITSDNGDNALGWILFPSTSIPRNWLFLRWILLMDYNL